MCALPEIQPCVHSAPIFKYSRIHMNLQTIMTGIYSWRKSDCSSLIFSHVAKSPLNALNAGGVQFPTDTSCESMYVYFIINKKGTLF